MVVVMLIGWYIFFVAEGVALVLTSGAGRPRSAPVIPIFRSRSRRESAATASADLLAALYVVHDGRGHLLYRVPYFQLLIRCLLLLLLLLLLRNEHEIHSGQLKIYYGYTIDILTRINSTQNIVILMSRILRSNYSQEYF